MVWWESQQNFTKNLVTFASGGGRRSSWAPGYVEFHRQSISGTLGAIPRTLGHWSLKKASKPPNPTQTGHFGFGEYLSIREPTVTYDDLPNWQRPLAVILTQASPWSWWSAADPGTGYFLKTGDPNLRESKSQDIGGNPVTSQIQVWKIIFVMPHYTYDVIIIICVVWLIKIDSVMIIVIVTWDGFLRPVSQW